MRFEQFNEPIHRETRSDRIGDWLVLLFCCAALVAFMIGAIP